MFSENYIIATSVEGNYIKKKIVRKWKGEYSADWVGYLGGPKQFFFKAFIDWSLDQLDKHLPIKTFSQSKSK